MPIFVDDITFASKSKDALDKFVVDLGKHFKLRDLDETNYLLDVEITRNRKKQKLYLSQHQYIINKLEEFNMSDCKPVGTPMLPGLKLMLEQCPKTSEEINAINNIPYISAVGSLMYLAMMTRLDIAYIMALLARFNHNPDEEHWKAVKHLFRYLKGTLDMKLEYGPDSTIGNEMFVTYSDADHGGDRDSRKSTSGYMVKIGTGAVAWRSKLQPVVTRSAMEAEFIAAEAAGMEICWIQNILKELRYMPTASAKLYMDNQSSMSQPIYIPTEDMPADLLTKALPKPQVEKLQRMMGLVM